MKFILIGIVLLVLVALWRLATRTTVCDFCSKEISSWSARLLQNDAGEKKVFCEDPACADKAKKGGYVNPDQAAAALIRERGTL